MKLTKFKLKQIIAEEVAQAVKEGDVTEAGAPWPTDADPAGEELPAEFQYEYVLDELVNAARDGIMPLAVKKLKDAGAFKDEGTPERVLYHGLTYNDIELEIEEGLLDALKPLAKVIHAYMEKT